MVCDFGDSELLGWFASFGIPPPYHVGTPDLVLRSRPILCISF